MYLLGCGYHKNNITHLKKQEKMGKAQLDMGHSPIHPWYSYKNASSQIPFSFQALVLSLGRVNIIQYPDFQQPHALQEKVHQELRIGRKNGQNPPRYP
jgi:hypothetical protein